MAIKKEDFLARLDTALQDSAEELQPDDKSRILNQAVILFSKDRPLTKIKEETGDGASYDFALPSDWVDGFSSVLGQMEYPADNSQDPSYLEDGDWMFFEKLVSGTTTTYIRMRTFIPATAEVLRYKYSLPHTLTDSSCTIKENDIEAVVNLTAYLCFWALAAKYAQSTDSTIEADIIDYQRKSDTYSMLAKEKLALYNSLMGLGAESKGAAPATAGVSIKDIDLPFSWTEDMLTHPMRQR